MSRRWAVVAVMLLLGTPLTAQAGGVAEAVMSRLASLPGRQARFTEEKRLSSITVPLMSQGRLVFRPPGHLEKDTEAPARESLVIDGDSLTITGADGQTRTIGLDESAALRTLADTLRAALAGDLAMLRRLYDVEEQGTEAAWRLLMTPRAAAIRRALVRVTIDGAGTDVRQIVIQQGNGDEDRLVVSTGS